MNLIRNLTLKTYIIISNEQKNYRIKKFIKFKIRFYDNYSNH